jgi:DNA-binding protein HU-beta
MNKAELIDQIAQRTGVSKKDVGEVIDGLLAEIADVVSEDGGKISLPGFLSIERVERKARQGRNPQTGAMMDIPSSHGVRVRAGSRLKAAGKGPGWTGPKDKA